MPAELRAAPKRALQPTSGLREFRGSLLGPGDADYTDESPEGITSIPDLLHRFSSFLPSMGDVGGGSQAVAFKAVTPGAIRALSERGAKAVESIKSKGLPLIGKDIGKYEPLNSGALKALEIAQQRWPRLFGHASELSDIEAGKIDRFVRDIRGSNIQSPVSTKLSKTGLNPKTATPDTVGHELLHAADRITDPKFQPKYEEAIAKLGYRNAPQEIRARAMGSRFQDIYDTVMARGGQARDEFGRNIRVPKRK